MFAYDIVNVCFLYDVVNTAGANNLYISILFSIPVISHKFLLIHMESFHLEYPPAYIIYINLAWKIRL